MAADERKDDIAFQGWLSKQGGFQGGWENWKRRWIVVRFSPVCRARSKKSYTFFTHVPLVMNGFTRPSGCRFCLTAPTPDRGVDVHSQVLQ